MFEFEPTSPGKPQIPFQLYLNRTALEICIPAGILRPDLGDLAEFGSLFGPTRYFHHVVDFLGLRQGGYWA